MLQFNRLNEWILQSYLMIILVCRFRSTRYGLDFINSLIWTNQILWKILVNFTWWLHLYANKINSWSSHVTTTVKTLRIYRWRKTDTCESGQHTRKNRCRTKWWSQIKQRHTTDREHTQNVKVSALQKKMQVISRLKHTRVQRREWAVFYCLWKRVQNHRVRRAIWEFRLQN